MDVRINPNWNFQASNHEARLIILSLIGGKGLSNSEKEEAKALGNRLTEMRAREVEDMHKVMQGHIRAMQAEIQRQAEEAQAGK